MLSPSQASLPEKNILDLQDRGWTVLDAYWDRAFLQELKTQAEKLWQSGAFKEAQIGRGSGQQLAKNVRSDSIHWLNLGEFLDLQRHLQSLMQNLNETFYLGLKDIECHFARYAAGKGYEEHLDRSDAESFRNSLHGQREISFVLYLNPNWLAEHGGQLQIREGEKTTLVEPLFGRLVLMKSAEVLHAVLPSHSERWSLTGWYRRF